MQYHIQSRQKYLEENRDAIEAQREVRREEYREKARLRSRVYYWANKAAVLAYAKERYAESSAVRRHISLRGREYRAKHLPETKESSAQWRRENAAGLAARNARWRRENATAIALVSRARRERNRDEIRSARKQETTLLKDQYVKAVLRQATGLSATQIPDDLIEKKRSQLALVRAARAAITHLKGK